MAKRLGLALSALLLVIVAQARGAELRLTPGVATINSPGGSTSLTLQVDDPAEIVGYTFGITYPAELLGNVNVIPSPLLSASCVATFNANHDGRLCLALGCSQPLPGANVDLLSLSFSGESNGSAPVHFAATACGGPALPACLLEDIGGSSLPCITSPATIEVEMPASVPPPLRGKRTDPARDTSVCQAVWRIDHSSPAVDTFGLPAAKQTCRDGDPGCDFDPEPNQCGFRARLCLNNSDPLFPACTPQGISSAVLLSPKAGRIRTQPLGAILDQDVAEIQHALQHLADPNQPDAGFSFAPPLSGLQQNLCSAPFLIRIPVRQPTSRSTQRRLSVRLRSADGALPRPRIKGTSVTLMCRAEP